MIKEIIIGLIPAILGIIAFIASGEVRKFIYKHKILTFCIAIFLSAVFFYVPTIFPVNPKSLETLDVITYRDTYFNEGDCVSSSGRSYSGNYYILLSSFSSEHGAVDSAYVEFKANKKYITITGEIAPHKSIGSAADEEGIYGSEWGIKIFADNKLIYTSPVITKETHEVPFTVSELNNCDIIRIETYGDYYAHLLLLDPKVY